MVTQGARLLGEGEGGKGLPAEVCGFPSFRRKKGERMEHGVLWAVIGKGKNGEFRQLPQERFDETGLEGESCLLGSSRIHLQ